MRYWLAIALAIATFMGALPATHAQTRIAQEISGSYSCAGTNADGSRYTGVVTIERQGGGYRFHWEIDDGSSYDGQGLRSGSRITVYWGEPEPVIYRIGNDGVLYGTWGPGGQGRETLYPY